MKKIPALYYMLILSALVFLGAGAYLKYVVLAPLNLYQDEHLAAIPFLLMADEQTQYLLRTETVVNEPEVTEESVPEPETAATEPESIEEVVTEPVMETTVPVITEPVVEETEEVTPEPTVLKEVDESWFDDALFVGDSRTQGLANFGRLGNATYFANVGLSVYSIQSVRIGLADVGKGNLKSLLMKKDFGKIYISLGLNEIMGDHDNLITKYQEVIDMIQEIEPDAVIILQGIMTVGREKAAVKACFHPDYIASLNERIKGLAVGDKMRYIDVNEWIADEEGYLPDGWSKDGTHPYADGYYEWGQWILQNASTLGIE